MKMIKLSRPRTNTTENSKNWRTWVWRVKYWNIFLHSSDDIFVVLRHILHLHQCKYDL